jgi:hypothetical protein
MSDPKIVTVGSVSGTLMENGDILFWRTDMRLLADPEHDAFADVPDEVFEEIKEKLQYDR